MSPRVVLNKSIIHYGSVCIMVVISIGFYREVIFLSVTKSQSIILLCCLLVQIYAVGSSSDKGIHLLDFYPDPSSPSYVDHK
jgi:hypothetical protein